MSVLKLGLTRLAAFVVASGMALPASAAVDAYLKIGDIKGESMDAEHSGDIEVLSWSFGASQGGMMMGRPSMMGSQQPPPPGPGAMTITKSYDKASPKLLEACARGQHIPKAVLSVRKTGGGQQQYLTYELENVMISGYSMSSGGDRPTESLSLNYTKIQFKNDSPATGQAPGMTKPGMMNPAMPGAGTPGY